MAKRYTFRLATVLRLREMAEDECRRQVAVRLRDIAQAESDGQRLVEQFEWEVSRSRDDQQKGAMDVLTVRRRRAYMGYLQRRQRECAARVAGLRQQLAQEQAALAHAAKEVKVLEKLRERQAARHAEIERRAERAAEDEVAQSLTFRAGTRAAGSVGWVAKSAGLVGRR